MSRYMWQKRDLVEDIARVDIRDVRASHLLPSLPTCGNADPNARRGMWSATGHVEGVRGLGRAWVSLDLDLDTGSGAGTVTFAGHQRACVALTATRQHFGGWRWWWTCPRCGRSCGVLYRPPGLACRRCSDLAYETTRLDDHVRALVVSRRRLARTERRLGPRITVGGVTGYIKPPGMWMRTWRCLSEQYLSQVGADNAASDAMVGALASTTERLLGEVNGLAYCKRRTA